MKNSQLENSEHKENLINTYLTMSQNGAVSFFEETAFIEIIEHFENKHDTEGALEAIDYAIAQNSYADIFYHKKAKNLLIVGLMDEALEAIEMALIINPETVDAQFLKAQALYLNAEHDLAIQIVDKLKNSVDSSELFDIYILASRIYEDLGDNQNTFIALKEALLIREDNIDALERLWLCVEMSGMYNESIKLHKELLDRNPYLSLAWFNLGHAYTYFELYEKAVEAFEFAYIINNKFEFAYRDCGNTYIKMGQYEEALSCFNDALEFISPDSEILTKMGDCLFNMNKYEYAHKYFSNAIKMDGDNHEAYYKLGESLAKVDLWKKALNAFHSAHKLHAKREEYIAALAEAHAQLEDYDQAQYYFEKACETAPESSFYWIQHARFLMEIDAFEHALEVLSEAEIYAQGSEIIYAKAACLFSFGLRKEGFNILEDALQEDLSKYTTLFDIVPALKNDEEIISAIQFYKS